MGAGEADGWTCARAIVSLAFGLVLLASGIALVVIGIASMMNPTIMAVTLGTVIGMNILIAGVNVIVGSCAE